MKKNLGRIIGIIFVLILGYQQFCYADVITPDDLMDFIKNKNNTRSSNSTYSNTTNNNNSTYSDTTKPNNTIAPKSVDIEKDNNILPTFLIAGGLVIIAVGTSIIILNKSKRKNENNQ